MTQEELDKIIEQHKLWLKTDGKEGRQADLSGTDLRGKDLKGTVLVLANLKGANLNGLDLSFSNLNSANLEEANLEMANLSFSKLEESNLTRANLKGASLYRARVSSSNLSNVNLEGAVLEGANLICSNLTGSNLSNANLMRAGLQLADLTKANLTKADLTDANLEGTNLCGSNLEWANLNEANLEDANLTGANLEGANLEGLKLSGVNLAGAILPTLFITSKTTEVSNNAEGGKKYDGDPTSKPPLQLVPPKAMSSLFQNREDVQPILKYQIQGDPELLIQAASKIAAIYGADTTNSVVYVAALVGAFGAKKYGDGNYLLIEDASRYVGAALRHLLLADPKSADNESTLPHWYHAVASLLMAYESHINYGSKHLYHIKGE